MHGGKKKKDLTTKGRKKTDVVKPVNSLAEMVDLVRLEENTLSESKSKYRKRNTLPRKARKFLGKIS